MINLINYICENARSTASNADRRKELEEWLKNKNYPDYVDTLNKMLDDPKAKALLQDGFGGKLGNFKLTFSEKQIVAGSLRPTQSEIDINKSLKHSLRKVENIKNDFENESVIVDNMPIITFRGEYIIDGHHRWLEMAVLNPEGKMTCFNYDGDISSIQMLKAVQGAIAAVMAEKNDGELPKDEMGDKNIYNMSKDEIDEYINKTITQRVCNYLTTQNLEWKNSLVVSQEDAINYVIEGCVRVQNNNYPEAGMPKRNEMPQTDKAGKTKGDKSSSFPDKEGSALHKLKNGKIDKNAIT